MATGRPVIAHVLHRLDRAGAEVLAAGLARSLRERFEFVFLCLDGLGPLAEELEVTGPVEMVLYVSSSRPDTDFTAKLLDVYPDGRAFNLTEGILRARYRDGYDRQVWMRPGEVYRIAFRLRPTSNNFLAGHRIRLEISSSSFPQYDRNLNTGGSNFDETMWVVAENTVHHSEEYPSHVKLPVIPGGQVLD